MSEQATTYDPIPETCQDALRMWDAGESVFTVEMGGLGPGYEQAIQMLAFEIIRDLIGEHVPAHGVELSDTETKRIRKITDATVHRLDKEPWAGFSGAQVGAATNIAMCVLRRGYRAALRDPAVQDRLIQVSKVFPPAAKRV
jgi:hypothetical protein